MSMLRDYVGPGYGMPGSHNPASHTDNLNHEEILCMRESLGDALSSNSRNPNFYHWARVCLCRFRAACD